MCGAAGEFLLLPGVLQAAEKKCKAAAAVRETNAQARGQAIERAADDQRHERELRFRGHADGPRHHVFRHALRGHHVPGMNEHGGALVRAMVEERDDSRVVEILVADVIADLHAEMPGAHAASEFGAGSVNILQRHLAERAQSSFAASAEFQRRVVKNASAIQRLLRFAVVGKKHGRGGNDLMSLRRRDPFASRRTFASQHAEVT